MPEVQELIQEAKKNHPENKDKDIWINVLIDENKRWKELANDQQWKNRKTMEEKIEMVESHKVELEESKKHCKIELDKAHKALDDLRKGSQECISLLRDMNIDI